VGEQRVSDLDAAAWAKGTPYDTATGRVHELAADLLDARAEITRLSARNAELERVREPAEAYRAIKAPDPNWAVEETEQLVGALAQLCDALDALSPQPEPNP
jgi:hypothetical protein